MKKALTVTVPSYNAEKFLKKGIPTLLDDRIIDDIEVIIVDDGSKDATAEIADDFARAYPKSVKVVHKENGGHGSGVNTGIEHATAEYFCVVDADDWVDTENFVQLVGYLKNNNADICLTHAARVSPEGKVFGYEKVEGIQYGKLHQLENAFERMSNIDMHNYYIKTDVLRKSKARCHEHCFYVDQEYIIYSLVFAKTVIAYDMTVYQYLIGRDGQSVSMASRRKYLGDTQKVQQYLVDFYNRKKNTLTPNQKKYLEKKIARFIRGYYATLLSYKKTQPYKSRMEEFDKCLKQAAPEVYRANRNMCIIVLRKSRFVLYDICKIIYRIVFNKNLKTLSD